MGHRVDSMNIKLIGKFVTLIPLVVALFGCGNTQFERLGATGNNSHIPRVVPVDNPMDSDGNLILNPTQTAGFDPSRGSGGRWAPGTQGDTLGGATVYCPSSYDSERASPIIFLFNMDISQWKDVADRDGIFLVATNSSNNNQLIFARINEGIGVLEDGYNVDRARVYFAGFASGGDIALINGTDPVNASEVAGIMVFPGSGGSKARRNLLDARQQGKRAVGIYITVGMEDRATGYYPGAINQARLLLDIPGYRNRIKYQEWIDEGHHLPVEAFDQGWQFVQQFNTVNN